MILIIFLSVAGGEWWWIYIGWCWLVVEGDGGNGGYTLVGDGWWWVVVKIFWLVVGGGIVQSDLFKNSSSTKHLWATASEVVINHSQSFSFQFGGTKEMIIETQILDVSETSKMPNVPIKLIKAKH